jgi:V-type H+-transporting ATPase subunit a
MLLSYPTTPDTPQSSLQFYHPQRTLQTILLLVAVLCIPWMLVGKPIYIILQKNKQAKVNEILFFQSK